VVGLATVRNWLVADRFVPVATSFGINLRLGNQPTVSLDATPDARTALYERLGLEGDVRTVVEFAVQTPGDFGRGLVNKALYTFGFFGRSNLPGGIGTSWLYVGTWLLAFTGVVRIVRMGPGHWSPVGWLPAAGALSHFVSVVLVFPYGYTDRLIVPLYPLLIPYAAYAVEPLLPVVVRLVAALREVRQIAVTWSIRTVSPLAPILRERRNWAYFVYSAAVVYRAEGREVMDALLLPVTVLAIVRTLRAELLRLVAGGILGAAALVSILIPGSRSASAPNDPLFWAAIAALLWGLSAITGRWPGAAFASAAIAGAATTIGFLLPAFPAFETNFPDLSLTIAGESLRQLSRQFGVAGVFGLLAIWLQGIVSDGPSTRGLARILGAARGALLAGLGLTLAGAVPETQVETRLWLLALGVLVGLVEADARLRPTRGDRDGMQQ
jgi:hypothetical protein